MPVAIVVLRDGTIPGIFSEQTHRLLLEKLRKVPGAPELPTVAAARDWLLTLDRPSGWYESVELAQAYLSDLKRMH